MSGFKINFPIRFASESVQSAQVRLANRRAIANRDLTGPELTNELLAANAEYELHVSNLDYAAKLSNKK